MSRQVRTRWWPWVGIGLLVVVVLVLAARPTPTAGDSDDRLFAIAGQMKCLACAGESVANSQAPLAIEMRGLIGRQMRSVSVTDALTEAFRASGRGFSRRRRRKALRPERYSLTATPLPRGRQAWRCRVPARGRS